VINIKTSNIEMKHNIKKFTSVYQRAAPLRALTISYPYPAKATSDLLHKSRNKGDNALVAATVAKKF
jgi:hypothetical protein